MSDEISVRPARAGEIDLLARLLYGVSPKAHERFAGDRERAVQLIVGGLRRVGTSGSQEVTHVAELDGRVAGVVCCYPVWEGPNRASAYAQLGLHAAPFWRRPAMLRFLRRMERATPAATADSMYVDALGTAPRYRRRGVARALLAAVEGRARRVGLEFASLETEVDNHAARSLYESCGFLPGELGRDVRALPRYIAYVKSLGQ